MYEKIAWNNFCKTGSVESYLEYKNICANLGEKTSEANKSKGDSNKRDTLQG